MYSYSIAIHADGVRKSYGKTTALAGVSLDVGAGEAVGLIGPNGAGKTTLLGCLLGLIDPDGGTIEIGGGSPHAIATKRKVGYVPERLSFGRWMTGRRFVTMHARLAGASGDGEVEAMLDRVGLQREAWDRPMKKYSRGMLQRTALAQALIGGPEFLFLDEPSSGIDPAGAVLFREILLELKERGVAILLNSHQLDQMEQICDRVAFIRAGAIEAEERVESGARALERRFLELHGRSA